MNYVGMKHFPPPDTAEREHGWWTDGQREWFGPKPNDPAIKAAVKRDSGDCAGVASARLSRGLIDP